MGGRQGGELRSLGTKDEREPTAKSPLLVPPRLTSSASLSANAALTDLSAWRYMSSTLQVGKVSKFFSK